MRAAVDRIDDAGAVAAGVIAVGGDMTLSIGNRLNLTRRIVREGRNVVQRISDLRQSAPGVVGPGMGPGVGDGSRGGIGGGPFLTGGGVSAPQLIYDPEPEYSEEAR